MKTIFISLVFLFAFSTKMLATAIDDTTKINCYYNQVFENFCATCVDQISYEVFTGIEVEKYDSTYRIYPPYKIFDEDTFTVIQDVYNNLVYIDLDTTIFSTKEDVAEYIASCVGDTSVLDVTAKQDKIQWKKNYANKGSNGEIKKVNFKGTGITVTDSLDWLNILIDTSTTGGGGGSDCNCCDSLLFFMNDTNAHNQAWFNKGDYYNFSEDNTHGWAWGTLRQIKQDVGFTISESDGIVTGIDVNVGFNGRSPRCKFNAPNNVLEYYENDTAAVIGGLSLYEYYMLTATNTYGMQKGTIKKITEP